VPPPRPSSKEEDFSCAPYNIIVARSWLRRGRRRRRRYRHCHRRRRRCCTSVGNTRSCLFRVYGPIHQPNLGAALPVMFTFCLIFVL